MRKLYEICYGTEPTEREIALLEIQYQRLQDNGFTNKEAKQLIGRKTHEIGKPEQSIVRNLPSWFLNLRCHC